LSFVWFPPPTQSGGRVGLMGLLSFRLPGRLSALSAIVVAVATSFPLFLVFLVHFFFFRFFYLVPYPLSLSFTTACMDGVARHSVARENFLRIGKPDPSLSSFLLSEWVCTTGGGPN